MYKLFHVNQFKTVNNVSVILLDGKGTVEMGKLQEGKGRVTTLIDSRLTILSRFLFRVPIMCSACYRELVIGKTEVKDCFFPKEFLVYYRGHGFLAHLFTEPDLATPNRCSHRAGVLKVWSLDQQHLHHLGTC